MSGVAEQFDLLPEVRWDDLGPDALREAVLRVHNTVEYRSPRKRKHALRYVLTPGWLVAALDLRAIRQHLAQHERRGDAKTGSTCVRYSNL